jgi:calmodulin-regulated spectrin-associated protein
MFSFSDICLKSNIGIADSLYNLSQVKNFCSQHLPINCFHLAYEDFLYTHNNLKQNLYVLLADLFYWFEINRAPSVSSPSREDTGLLYYIHVFKYSKPFFDTDHTGMLYYIHV